jgi:hypothetical protein
MLHTFFFAWSFLMDYSFLAEVLREGVRFGLLNACLVGVAVLWLSVRGQRTPRK